MTKSPLISAQLFRCSLNFYHNRVWTTRSLSFSVKGVTVKTSHELRIKFNSRSDYNLLER